MADVFISYHETSAGELAEQIAYALEDAGISAWCARRDLPLGGNFAREIPEQIQACRLFLLLLNENVYFSEHVENEVGIAFSRRNKREDIKILPLKIGDFTRKEWVQYYLIHTQFVSFPAQPDERNLQRLVKRIIKELKPLKRNECGNHVTYTLDERGGLTISGNGPMRNFALHNAVFDTPWKNESNSISHVEIQSGVTTIGVGAFAHCVKLISVTIPTSITQIEMDAFRDCLKLESVIIPDSVTVIGEGAFYNCEELTSVTIPNSVTQIGAFAFRDCAGLTSVSISNSLTEIPQGIFDGCAGLKGVTIPNSVTEIGKGAFYACEGLTSVTIPNRVTTIGRRAFAHCEALASVTIPDSVTKIEEVAFKGCTNLKRVSVLAQAKIDDTSFPDWTNVERRP